MNNRSILGIEIDNPYRYRSYFVDELPKYDIQNESGNNLESVKVSNIIKSINSNASGFIYKVIFADGKMLQVINSSNLIVHYAKAV